MVGSFNSLRGMWLPVSSCNMLTGCSETWSWDVRTKNVTYEPIPTVEHVQGITSYGATGVLFTIGPNYSIQQYDLDRCVMTANVQILPPSLGGTPFEEDQAGRPTHEDNDLTSPAPQVLRTNSEIVRIRHTNAQKERLSNLYGNEDPDPSATSFTGRYPDGCVILSQCTLQRALFDPQHRRVPNPNASRDYVRKSSRVPMRTIQSIYSSTLELVSAMFLTSKLNRNWDQM